LVETAVNAAAAAGTEPPTASEISAMVQSAVASATTPGVTKEEIQDLVVKAVSESASSSPSPLSNKDIEDVVSKAILAMPTAAPVVVELVVTPTPGAVQPRGTLIVAVNVVGPASSYRPKEMLWPYNNRALLLGIYESALRWDKDFVIVPSLASSWVLTADDVTLTVREDVPFHDESTGTVTAEDFVFTFEDSRLDGNKKLGEVINPFYAEITAPDAMTVKMNLKSANMRWISTLTKLLDGNAPISSKKLFDQIGGDQANLTPNGTGPFRVIEQISDDSIVLEAFVPHWRQTAGFNRVEILEVPEDATKIAMLQTGEADIIPVTASQIDQVAAVPRARLIEGRQKFGSGGVNVWLSGQYYADTKKDGTPSGNAPATERPWVGDPSDPADMENARKVRMAMSMAVDREAIVDTILGGRGCLAYVIGIDSCNPRWNPEWKVPTDPAGAIALLTEAGYPDGFEFPFFIPVGSNPVLEEVGEALLPMWEAIGLTAKVEKAAYQAKQPSMLSKTISDAWIWNHSDYGLPINVISGIGFQTADTV
jgi:ABC-type transport system substrate-binding protein